MAQLPVDRGGDVGRDEVEREDLCVRVRDRGTRGAPVVDDGGGEREPGVEVRPHAVAQHREHLDGGIVGQVAERAVVVGREHDDLVGLDDRVQVREHAHPPTGLAGDAVSGAQDLGRRHRLVPGTERALVRAAVVARDPPWRTCAGAWHGRRR